MSAFRLSQKETAQFMRKLALGQKKKPWQFGRKPPLLRPTVEKKPPRMPADSLRASCKCGLGIMLYGQPDMESEKRYLAEVWWKRHSGEGHGKI